MKNNILEGKNANKGNVVLIKNTEKEWNENDKYYFINIQMPSGNERPIMLTESEMIDCMQRADRNVEDWIQKGFWSDLID